MLHHRRRPARDWSRKSQPHVSPSHNPILADNPDTSNSAALSKIGPRTRSGSPGDVLHFHSTAPSLQFNKRLDATFANLAFNDAIARADGEEPEARERKSTCNSSRISRIFFQARI